MESVLNKCTIVIVNKYNEHTQTQMISYSVQN
jgi:hypothetical protein